MEQVERDCPLPHVEIHLVHGQVFLQRAAGAVEYHIEASKPRDRRFNGAAHCLILCHVGLDEKRVSARCASLVLGSFAQFRVEVDDRDSRTCRNKNFLPPLWQCPRRRPSETLPCLPVFPCQFSVGQI